MTSCLIHWTHHSTRGTSDPDWGCMSFQKWTVLPFYPRKGDSLYLNRCGPFAVDKTNYDVDGGFAEVFVDGVAMSESWDELIEKMSATGWEYADRDGSARKDVAQ